MSGKNLFASFLGFSFLLVSASPSFAVVQSLNGQTGQNQTFVNDSNVTISSASNAHTVTWQGILPIFRGGTGKNSFTDGSVPFISGGVFAEDNENFFWDNGLKRLGIGTTTPAAQLHVNGSILSAPADGDPNAGIRMDPNGDIDLQSINFLRPIGLSQIYESFEGTVGVSPGLVIEESQNSGIGVKLNVSELTDSIKTIGFQNRSGTLSLLEADQSFSGLNKFEAESNSTIYVGSLSKSGCIALGDSDGDGVTYITANDGVLSASSTKPSTCQ